MFFFIADTHFGHGAIIDLCHRPFKCLEEMDSFMIGRWNEKVSHNDTVYVVGDLFYKHEDPEKTLKQLKGKKRLIIGNHDGGWLKRLDASRYFLSVDHFIEVSDGKHKLVLCHYPLIHKMIRQIADLVCPSKIIFHKQSLMMLFLIPSWKMVLS